MNGTDSRQEAKFMTFNQDPTQVAQSTLSSIAVGNLVSISDNMTLIYSVKATIPDGAPLNGTHHGFLRVNRVNSIESRVFWLAIGF